MNPTRLQSQLNDLNVSPIVIMSHERSGTHLNIDLLRKQMKECGTWKWPGQPLSRLYISVESLDNPGAPTPTSSSTAIGVMRRGGGAPLFKTHLTYQQLVEGAKLYGHALPDAWREWLLKNARFCYVYRDGREVMCSLYLFRDYDPVMAKLTWPEFLRNTHLGPTPPRQWADHVRQGLAIPDVYPMRWESVVKDTRSFLESTAQEFQLSLRSREPLLPARRNASRLSSLWGRLAMTLESTAIVHPRPSAKWPSVFTAEDAQFFSEQSDYLTEELTYEADRSWTERIASDHGVKNAD